MNKNSIILITDFGVSDIYVGIMKGVINSINPDANIIDLTHDIAPQNIRQAAFLLKCSYKYFPEGSIFETVVDPGVGSERKAIIVKASNRYFVCPDNGMITFMLDEIEIEKIVEIDLSKPDFIGISNTFHGRDVFAPVAAKLSMNNEMNKFGNEIELINLVRIEPMQVSIKEDSIETEIMHIDHFGNIITSISGQHFEEIIGDKKNLELKIEGKKCNLKKTFSEVPENELLAYNGSFGYLEIGVNGGNAQKYLNKKITDRITMFF